tara:strand:+ start:455 stop:1657 length:1203 start_codon:yes stop_codon:yes gene_type:complete
MATYESVRYQFTGANIDSASIPSPTIANGSVTNTEFQTVDATSSIQTQLNSKFGAAGGTFTSDVTLADNVDLNVGNGNDLILTSNGTVGFVKGNSITIEDASGNDMATYTANGAAELFFGGAKKIETSNTGATVTGALVATSFSGNGASLSALTAANIASPGTLPALVGTALTSLNAANLIGTYAALNGGSITSINASNVASGTLANARLPSSISVSNVAGTLSGNGASVTSINGSNISSGTVADARISSLTASKLTGALPAIDGSALTGIDTVPSSSTAVGAIKYFALYYDGSGTDSNTSIGVGTEVVPSTYNSSNKYLSSSVEYNNSASSSGPQDTSSLGYLVPGFAGTSGGIQNKTRATETGTWRCISSPIYNKFTTSGNSGGTYTISGGGLFQRIS